MYSDKGFCGWLKKWAQNIEAVVITGVIELHEKFSSQQLQPLI